MTILGTIQFEIQPPFMSGPGLPAVGVELHGESLAQRAVQHRKKEITSPWVAGSFVTRSVKDQVTEQISLWISGEPSLGDEEKSTQQILAERVDSICACFDQLQYEVAITIGDVRELWTCSTADYVVVTEQAHLQEQIALIKATVPRQPQVVRTFV